MNKNDFPIFSNRDLVYLDSAATSQKPSIVIDALKNYYENSNANVGRGAYSLAVESTELYENARTIIRKFINAKKNEEIIFTKNTTESTNTVAYSYILNKLNEGDEIALLISEHHANLLPWQNMASVKGLKLNYLYFDEKFEITDSEILNKITSKTKFVACAIVSNALGIINPVEKIIKRAHEFGAIVLVDAAQAVAHMKIDVQKLDADFLVFSSHKMYGPMGIGVLYGKKSLLENMTPLILGGNMVEYVYENTVSYNVLPYKFEGGTPDVAGAVGFGVAVNYLLGIGFDKIEEHQKKLFDYAIKELSKLDYVKIIGEENKNRIGIISINVDGVHSHDVASILDSKNVCIRSGNHCAQPLMRNLCEQHLTKNLCVNSTVRISFGIYNDESDVDRLIEALKYAKELFSRELK